MYRVSGFVSMPLGQQRGETAASLRVHLGFFTLATPKVPEGLPSSSRVCVCACACEINAQRLPICGCSHVSSLAGTRATTEPIRTLLWRSKAEWRGLDSLP